MLSNVVSHLFCPEHLLLQIRNYGLLRLLAKLRVLDRLNRGIGLVNTALQVCVAGSLGKFSLRRQTRGRKLIVIMLILQHRNRFKTGSDFLEILVRVQLTLRDGLPELANGGIDLE